MQKLPLGFSPENQRGQVFKLKVGGVKSQMHHPLTPSKHSTRCFKGEFGLVSAPLVYGRSELTSLRVGRK